MSVTSASSPERTAGRLTGLGDCPALAFGDNPDGLCAWCGTPRPRGRRRWCSDDCADGYAQNHYWTVARSAALARDGYRCQRCGRGHGLITLLHLFLALYGHDPYWAYRPDVEVPKWLRVRWRLMTSGVSLEVNHRDPILGRHGESGCHHHLDGLMTLCHECHVKETAAQRRAGLLRR